MDALSTTAPSSQRNACISTSTDGRQKTVAAASMTWRSSSERMPATTPLSFTPTSNRPPSLLAKADMEWAIFRASVILILKS